MLYIDLHGRARNEIAKDEGALYIVSGGERRAFSNLAEFITLLDRFTLLFTIFISVSPPRSFLQKLFSLSYNEILLGLPTIFVSYKIFKVNFMRERQGKVICKRFICNTSNMT